MSAYDYERSPLLRDDDSVNSESHSERTWCPRPRFRCFRFPSCSLSPLIEGLPSCEDCAMCLAVTFGVVIVVCLVLSPFFCFGIYLYNVNYAKIYPGSKVAYDVFRNQHSENAFFFFYWFTACLIASGFAGVFHAAHQELAKRGVNPCGECFCILLVLFCIVLPYWIRFPIYKSMHHAAFWNSCDNWDIRAVIDSINYSPYVWDLPPYVLNITLTMDADVYALAVYRHPLSPLTYDLLLENTTDLFYTNITYDVGNSIISSTGLNLSYVTTPNLEFPSLDLSLANPGIPWTRPDYYTCWPPAVNLVHESQKVLQTITLHPSDCSTMLVCGSAGEELKNFQIALGLTAVWHFYYSLCCTAGSDQITFGGLDPEAEFGDDGPGIPGEDRV